MMKCSQPDFQINGFRSQDEKTPVHNGCVCLQRLEALGVELIVLPQGHLKAIKDCLPPHSITVNPLHCSSKLTVTALHQHTATKQHSLSHSALQPPNDRRYLRVIKCLMLQKQVMCCK